MVIPAPLRHRLKILTGTKIHISEQQGRLILQPITKKFIRSLRGSLKRKPSALNRLLKEHRGVLKREELDLRR